MQRNPLSTPVAVLAQAHKPVYGGMGFRLIRIGRYGHARVPAASSNPQSHRRSVSYLSHYFRYTTQSLQAALGIEHFMWV